MSVLWNWSWNVNFSSPFIENVNILWPVKDIIVMYMAFCRETDRDLAACLKTLNNYVF
jgi:hypothetical protein